MPAPLWKRQTAMMLRQAARRGRRRLPWLKTERLAVETHVREQMFLLWKAGLVKTEEELARRFDRPLEWVRAFIDAGFPLEP